LLGHAASFDRGRPMSALESDCKLLYFPVFGLSECGHVRP
jgi:hypothetical protein